MRLLSYVFLFALCLIACFVYVKFVWIVALSPASYSSFASVSQSTGSGENASIAQPIVVQSNAVAVVSYMGLPGSRAGAWHGHVLFFTLVWVCFLLAAFVDLLLS